MSNFLLVDDNETQHELFRCYAMDTDFNFRHAVNLEDATKQLREQKPDVVFLDNRLTPFPDFRETIPVIRNAGYDGKIVVISSDVKHPIFELASEYSIHAYMNKFEITLSNFSDVMNKLVEVPVKSELGLVN